MSHWLEVVVSLYDIAFIAHLIWTKLHRDRMEEYLQLSITIQKRQTIVLATLLQAIVDVTEEPKG